MDDQNKTQQPPTQPVGDQGGVPTPPAAEPVVPEVPTVPPAQSPMPEPTPTEAPVAPVEVPTAPQPGTDTN